MHTHQCKCVHTHTHARTYTHTGKSKKTSEEKKVENSSSYFEWVSESSNICNWLTEKWYTKHTHEYTLVKTIVLHKMFQTGFLHKTLNVWTAFTRTFINVVFLSNLTHLATISKKHSLECKLCLCMYHCHAILGLECIYSVFYRLTFQYMCKYGMAIY